MSIPGTFAETVSSLTGLFWFLLAAVAVGLILPELRKIVQGRNFTIEVAGLKLSAQEASEELSRQVEDLQTQVAELQLRREQVLAPTPSRELESQNDLRLRQGEYLTADQLLWPRGRPTALWVDDRPEGNAYEIKSLTSDGWEIDTARSTQEAMSAHSKRSYDVLITDLGRLKSVLLALGARTGGRRCAAPAAPLVA